MQLKSTNQLKLKKNFEFSGLLNSEEITNEEIQKVLKCFKAFDIFIKKQYAANNVISNIFVFYLIPLHNIKAKPLPIYYIEHFQGNADCRVISDIYDVIEILKMNELKLCLKFLSLDGDLKYKSFHDTFLHEWMNHFYVSKNLFNSVNMLFHIICDPNHVLKRLRYRFVNHMSLAWTTHSRRYTSLDVQELFDIPEKVFSYNSTTKMDDFNPKELFKRKNLAILFAYELWDLFAYFLICTSLSLVVHENLPRRTGLMMLSISTEFLIIYRRYMNATKTEKIPYFRANKTININGTTKLSVESVKKQTKRAKSVETHNQYVTTTFLDRFLIDHLLNGLVTLISVLGTEEKSFSMIDYGTMLLEHYFGRVRLGCRYDYEIDRIINVIDRLIMIDHLNFQSPDLSNHVTSRDYEFAHVENGAVILNDKDILTSRKIALALWDLIDPTILISQDKELLKQLPSDWKVILDDIFDLFSQMDKTKFSPPRNKSTTKSHLIRQHNKKIICRYSNTGYSKIKFRNVKSENCQ
ncbi:hypothetical protein TRFO_04246 [Tritrichomonas foetus]|uniref:Uncharacterized protein n=1 Tax=Tritrichomonas foetus TaxID=1144522 RepID=A0A1J4KGA7_9EUKA|nr:hypothetical protein TRFO_04246 [Tritrichomonas foetus]|eukprot:OHT10243.1 hypothetical protein TRFO_04246 [Tritrichomonas foetus]